MAGRGHCSVLTLLPMFHWAAHNCKCTPVSDALVRPRGEPRSATPRMCPYHALRLCNCQVTTDEQSDEDIEHPAMSLWDAAADGDVEGVEEAIQRSGGACDLRERTDGRTAAHVAARHGQVRKRRCRGMHDRKGGACTARMTCTACMTSSLKPSSVLVQPHSLPVTPTPQAPNLQPTVRAPDSPMKVFHSTSGEGAAAAAGAGGRPLPGGQRRQHTRA